MSQDARVTALGQMMRTSGIMLACAESCTGGGIAARITAQAGSSEWFERGFVTYSNQAKQEMLGVPEDIIASYGAVSEQTVRAMVAGALRHSHAQVAVAVSGIAGPGGGSVEKPVGTVCLAWQSLATDAVTQSFCFNGDRAAVRRQAEDAAFDGLLQLLTRVA